MTKQELFGTEEQAQPDRDKKTLYHFYDIPYLEARRMNTFNMGEHIIVEEKIDGSNTSIFIEEDGTPRVFGRNWELNEKFNQRGAYQWCANLKDKILEVMGADAYKYVYFFEYLVEHHVAYREDAYNKGYLIGIRDKETRKYADEHKVIEIANRLGVEHPAVLYEGEFKGWDHIKSIVGQTRLGAKKGEGVVIKALDNKTGLKMLKVVSEEFVEKMLYSTEKREAEMRREQAKRDKIKEIVTDARIRKQLYKLVDMGIIKTSNLHDWSKEERALSFKYIGKLLYEDCIKEELDFVKEFGKDFGKYSFLTAKNFITSM